MKKIIFILTAIFCILFCSCGNSVSENEPFVISDTTYIYTEYLVNNKNIETYVDSMVIENCIAKNNNGDTIIVKHEEPIGESISPVKFVNFVDSLTNIYGNSLKNTHISLKPRPGYCVTLNPKRM